MQSRLNLDRFHAPRLKVWRAKQHLVQLASMLYAYETSQPILWIGTQLDGTKKHFDLEVRSAPPPTLPVVIGDIVHNLRGSLDLLANDLVRQNNNDPRHVYFPFAEDADELEKMIVKKHMHLASPEVVELVRSFKPYKGGNKALRAIHDLDIMDKHQLLIPASCSISQPNGAGTGHRDYREIKIGRRNWATVDDPKGIFPVGTYPARFTLEFPTLTHPFHTDAMVPVFERLTNDFLSIVHAFETLCFGAVAEGDW